MGYSSTELLHGVSELARVCNIKQLEMVSPVSLTVSRETFGFICDERHRGTSDDLTLFLLGRRCSAVDEGSGRVCQKSIFVTVRIPRLPCLGILV